VVFMRNPGDVRLRDPWLRLSGVVLCALGSLFLRRVQRHAYSWKPMGLHLGFEPFKMFEPASECRGLPITAKL
jgi:hypothetical protein